MADRYDCPIATCTWFYAPATEPAAQPALAEFYFTSSIDTRDRTIKRELDDHFASHGIDQWVAEVVGLRFSCDAANAKARRAELQVIHARWFIGHLRKSAKGRPDGPLLRALAKQLSELLREA